MNQAKPKRGLGVLSVGAAACAACCAGPILGLLAAVGLGTALGVAVFGVAGLAIAALAVVPIVRRRPQAEACGTDVTNESLPITLGRRPG